MYNRISKTIYNWIEAHVFRQVVLILLQVKFDWRLQSNFDLTQVDSQFPLSLLETKEIENQPRLQIKPEIKFDL